MAEVEMQPGVFDGGRYETVHDATDEIGLRVVGAGQAFLAGTVAL